MNRLPPPGAPARSFLIAHRGASAEYPENTLLAFRKAMEAGVRHLECDVRLSRDGVPVVIHDRSLDRTTDGAGDVGALSYSELRRFSAGEPARFGDRFRSERVPTLEEVLRLARGDAHLFIELKEDALSEAAGDALVRAVGDLVSAAGAVRGTTLISFQPMLLERASELPDRSGLGLGLLWDGKMRGEPVRKARLAGAGTVIVERTLLTGDLVAEARRHGLHVGTYLVDSEADLESVLAFAPLGIATNTPSKFLSHPALLGD